MAMAISTPTTVDNDTLRSSEIAFSISGEALPAGHVAGIVYKDNLNHEHRIISNLDVLIAAFLENYKNAAP